VSRHMFLLFAVFVISLSSTAHKDRIWPSAEQDHRRRLTGALIPILATQDGPAN
jgi:hypothetical protein